MQSPAQHASSVNNAEAAAFRVCQRVKSLHGKKVNVMRGERRKRHDQKQAAIILFFGGTLLAFSTHPPSANEFQLNLVIAGSGCCSLCCRHGARMFFHAKTGSRLRQFQTPMYRLGHILLRIGCVNLLFCLTAQTFSLRRSPSPRRGFHAAQSRCRLLRGHGALPKAT